MTDEYEHSGPRLVVHPTAFGQDVVQVCGYLSGRRTIRGSAVATTEAIALDWCRTQWDLAFCSQIGTCPGTRYRHPPRFAVRPAWVPLQASPTVRGDGANVAAYQASAIFLAAGLTFMQLREGDPRARTASRSHVRAPVAGTCDSLLTHVLIISSP